MENCLACTASETRSTIRAWSTDVSRDAVTLSESASELSLLFGAGAKFARLMKLINLAWRWTWLLNSLRRGPWITQFVIDGVATGGDYQVIDDRRVQQFFERFPNVRTILELGSLEGGHTFTLARHPCVERVLAIEARAANIEKAKFIGSLLGVSNVEFKQANLEQLQLTSLGYFDVFFAAGCSTTCPNRGN